VIGAITLAAFLLSGIHMRTHNPPLPQLEGDLHWLFVSRHIYILSAALLNLVLGAYIGPVTPRAARWQRIGSLLILVGAVLLMTAFIIEPMAGRSRTPVSSFGLFALFGGTLCHVGAALPRRR